MVSFYGSIANKTFWAILPFASSGNVSKMAEVVGPSHMPNQAVVAGSSATMPCPSRRNLATSFSLLGFAFSLTNKAFVVMS